MYGLLLWNMNRPDVEFCQKLTNFVGVTFVVWKSGYPDRFCLLILDSVLDVELS
jgi:hypothetical protein